MFSPESRKNNNMLMHGKAAVAAMGGQEAHAECMGSC
jgi:hypothetical protein